MLQNQVSSLGQDTDVILASGRWRGRWNRNSSRSRRNREPSNRHGGSHRPLLERWSCHHLDVAAGADLVGGESYRASRSAYSPPSCWRRGASCFRHSAGELSPGSHSSPQGRTWCAARLLAARPLPSYTQGDMSTRSATCTCAPPDAVTTSDRPCEVDATASRAGDRSPRSRADRLWTTTRTHAWTCDFAGCGNDCGSRIRVDYG